MEFEPLTGNIAGIAALCEVWKMPGEIKQRWPYLRTALSSTMIYTGLCIEVSVLTTVRFRS
jgi:hypothetical protein